MAKYADDTDAIVFQLRVEARQTEVDIPVLNPEQIYQLIVESPWVGNQPLKDCLKPGQSYNWEFSLGQEIWVIWAFQIKPGIKRSHCNRLLKQAVSDFIASYNSHPLN